MKIEQLLAQHFFSLKELTLQGIGTFTLSPDFVMPKESDKDLQLPDNAISFHFNSRAGEDAALIDFIIQQSRKMRSLASADLDSYLVLGKQFLNIGKPFKIDGMGMLVKNQQGEYAFTQGHNFITKTETISTTSPNPRDEMEEPDISFASQSKTSGSSKKGLMIAGFVIATGLIAATAWYFLNKKRTNIVPVTTPVIVAKDSQNIAPVKVDTMIAIKANTIDSSNNFSFKIVFMVTADSAAAVARMNVLTTRGHKIIMYKKDPLNFRLAEPFTLPLADTTHIKDSLNNFYYSGRAFIELQ